MSLLRFQDSFKRLMLDHPSALKNPTADLVSIFDTGDIALHERLAVYRNNVVGALSDVVVKTFPLVEALVGEDFLRGMAREFVLTNPPHEGCLNAYGVGLDDFIRGFKPAGSVPYLADIATLELAINNAYYAAEDAALTAEDLGAVAAEDLGELIFNTRSSVSILESAYPLLDIRAMCLRPDDDIMPDMDAGTTLMIHRPALEIVFTVLEPNEVMMLNALGADQPLGTAVESVIEKHPAFDFQAFLQKHLALKTFRALGSNISIQK